MIAPGSERGNELMPKSGEYVMENVRKYRAIASLHRQTAAFRPLQRWSLLEQAEQWENLAVAELETYLDACAAENSSRQAYVPASTGTRWGMAAAA
jgi:hypothetical protein